MTVGKNRIIGSVKSGKSTALKYILDLPVISGCQAEKEIEEMQRNVRQKVIGWLENRAESLIGSGEITEKQKRMYSEPPVYRLCCEVSFPDDEYIQLIYTYSFQGDSGEYDILISGKTGRAAGIGDFCKTGDRIRYSGCRFILRRNHIIVFKKGKMHKIKRI